MTVPSDCEYDRKVYANGRVFIPAGSGPCLQCRCKASLGGIFKKKVVKLKEIRNMGQKLNKRCK